MVSMTILQQTSNHGHKKKHNNACWNIRATVHARIHQNTSKDCFGIDIKSDFNVSSSQKFANQVLLLPESDGELTTIVIVDFLRFQMGI
jgi:hypothetical protein